MKNYWSENSLDSKIDKLKKKIDNWKKKIDKLDVLNSRNRRENRNKSPINAAVAKVVRTSFTRREGEGGMNEKRGMFVLFLFSVISSPACQPGGN